MTKEEIRSYIAAGEAILGLELGSTRIKAVLIGKDYAPIASGDCTWENQLTDGIWTYPEEEIRAGVQAAYRSLVENVNSLYGLPLRRLAAAGISGMMHGYLPFNRKGELLVPFRTWRNTITSEASQKLSEAFSFAIPQRWSVAHLYQAFLNKEPHLAELDFLTTVAGYIHRLLTGEKVLGIGEASGMFPVDSATMDYDAPMAEKFRELTGLSVKALFPKILPAGAPAGRLTPEGALFLDPTGMLEPGVPFAPPEGDAGTGMTATGSVTSRKGNVSAGTSIFAMVVLEKPLNGYYPEIDVAATPDGKPVAMVHCNNCTSDLNAWARLFMEFCAAAGKDVTFGEALGLLFAASASASPDGGGVLNYAFLSGEHIVGLDSGRPMLLRQENAAFNLGNFARAQLYACLATLRIGMDILLKRERVALDSLLGHGGLFKGGESVRQTVASVLGTPVSCTETAGEGGPWGMALLAAYLVQKEEGESLADFLAGKVFREVVPVTSVPDAEESAGFENWLESFQKGLAAEKAAVTGL